MRGTGTSKLNAVSGLLTETSIVKDIDPHFEDKMENKYFFDVNTVV